MTSISTPDIRELARRIAEELPGPGRWKLNKPKSDEQYWATIERDMDGAQLWLEIDRTHRPPRVIFHPEWPKPRLGDPAVARPNHGVRGSVACSAARDPAAIARDLERRLIKDFTAAYPAALERVRAEEDAADEIWRTAQEIARLLRKELPDSSREQRQNGSVNVEFHGSMQVRRIRIDCSSSGDIDVELRLYDLSRQTALRVLEFVVSAEQTSVTNAATPTPEVTQFAADARGARASGFRHEDLWVLVTPYDEEHNDRALDYAQTFARVCRDAVNRGLTPYALGEEERRTEWSMKCCEKNGSIEPQA
ncbi:hypothetical protein LVJ94_34750 [Pendulispora rubella]|uniref:Uncharacterized protein n=1 Tax=Pendulispora rubella TaxID=2741070 RepID=A0ABZ2KU29_9BACT